MKCPKCHFDNPSDSGFCSKCGTQIQLPPAEISISQTETLKTPIKELTTGSAFAGRYQVIEELGKGGMGRVYRVLDKKLNEEVALKLIKPEIAADKETIRRFTNELKLARKIAHRNVGKMYELMEDGGTHFITMEYIPGQDLKGLIRQTGQLTVGKAISIAKQVGEGLSEAHRLGIVHRDLKPGNILIDKDGNARIMDFGIARSLSGKGITGAGMMIGTPEYMSPEQVEGKEVDQRSDIYSLGIILYEMITGRVPFEGDTPLSVAVKHKTETPREPKSLNAQIPDELNLMILKCMKKEKEDRYQNAEELLSELDKIEEEIPTTEKVRAKKMTAGEAAKRLNWKRVSLAAAVLLLLMIVVAGVYLLTKRESPIDSIAVLPFDSKYADPEMEYISDGLTESLIGTLSKLPGLRVIARFSAFQYKGKKSDPRAVGRELNVKAILAGTVVQRGDNLSIIAELIDVKDKTRLWGEQYNRKVGDIVVLQEQISKDISTKLRLRLSGEEEKVLAKRYTENPEAYRLYLQGRFYWNRRTPVDLQKAITYFEKAVAMDSRFSLGYASLAETYIVLGSNVFEPPSVVYPRAEEFCLKALSLDEELVEAHSALGAIKAEWRWDFEGAETQYKRAIELNPNYATAHQWLAELCLILNQRQLALKEIHIAQELDPHSLIMKNVEAAIYLEEQSFDEAIQVIKGVVEENPDFDVGRFSLALAYSMKRTYDEALRIAEEIRMPSMKIILKGRIFAARGEMTKARQMLETYLAMSKDVYFDPCTVALLYGDFGELDEAFALFKKALEQRSPFLLRFNFFSPSDRVKQDPRFKELLKKIGLEK